MNPKLDVRFFTVAFFVLAIVLRLTPHAYNLAAVGALGLFVGCYWSARMGLLVSLAAMTLSDLLGHWLGIPSMGAYAIWLMVVVYVATACSALVGKLIGWSRRQSPKWLIATVPLGALGSSGVFFLMTNFASWLDPQMGYMASWTGLMECFTAAIPFWKNTLLGDLAFSAVFFSVFEFSRAWAGTSVGAESAWARQSAE